jgi:internalin A
MSDKTPEEAALERIRRNSRSRSKELDLSELGLTFVPKEVGKLTHLEELSLSDNTLTALPNEIADLTRLKKLYLNENQFADFPLVVCKLTRLEKLGLISNRLTSLPDHSTALKNLKWLALGNNFWTTTLQKANGDNSFPDLPDVIWELRSLEDLFVTAADVLSISPRIENLSNLKGLYLTTNSITVLPRELTKLPKLSMLEILNNPLNIPLEILGDSTNPRGILNYFFTYTVSSKRPLNASKVLVVGQGSVGKTSLIKRLTASTFDPSEVKTDGIAINRWQVDNQSEAETQKIKIQLYIWDFGGQEIMHATHQFFLTKRSIYLLVLDARLTQEENRVEYWLKIIQSFGGESSVLVIGNKTDQHPLDIDRTGLQKKYPNVVGILETSAATGDGIEALKSAITEQVNHLPHIHDLLPEPWFIVKNQLENLGRNESFITHDRYLEICAAGKIDDEISQCTLIGFMHDLGIVLHFQDDPRLEALGILNPQWVTNGVYKLLNSHALFQNKGVLTVSMLDDILNFPEYPRGKRLFIVDMMKKFELCYDIESDKIFLVPDLLPKDEPTVGDWNDAVTFQYYYNVLPSSILSRFIVRMNGFIHEIVWRLGVVLKYSGNTALVKADIEDRKVYIWVSGDEYSRRDFLAKIRGEFDAIHKTIVKIEAREMVPVPGHPEAEPVDYDLLLQMEHENVEVYPVRAGRKMILVNVRELLSGVARESDRQRGGSVINIHVSGDLVSEKTERNIQVGNISDATGIAIGEDTRATVSRKKADPE